MVRRLKPFIHKISHKNSDSGGIVPGFADLIQILNDKFLLMKRVVQIFLGENIAGFGTHLHPCQ